MQLQRACAPHLTAPPSSDDSYENKEDESEEDEEECEEQPNKKAKLGRKVAPGKPPSAAAKPKHPPAAAAPTAAAAGAAPKPAVKTVPKPKSKAALVRLEISRSSFVFCSCASKPLRAARRPHHPTHLPSHHDCSTWPSIARHTRWRKRRCVFCT